MDADPFADRAVSFQRGHGPHGEALLRLVDPYFDVLIMEVVSLDYCETVMAAAGHAAHAALHSCQRAGGNCRLWGRG